MSLLTRCPSCTTIFKVVMDQLKVSQGWVRCGHCSAVFDASLHLQAASVSFVGSLPTGKLPPVAPHPAVSPPPATLPPPEATAPAPPAPPALTSAPTAAAFEPQALDIETVDSAAPADLEPSAPPHPVTEKVERLPEPAAQAEAEAAPHPEPEPAPPSTVSFVRDAERKAFWRRTSTRLVLLALCCVLAGLLAVQIAVQQRDTLAAAQPQLRPLLLKLCEPLDCTLQALQRIESVVIESSSFNKLGLDSYALAFSLKNAGTLAVAMPSVEVSLTDAQDRAVMRKVLTPEQFGANASVLADSAEFAARLVLRVQADGAAPASPAANGDSADTVPVPSSPGVAGRIVGYRLLAFYP